MFGNGKESEIAKAAGKLTPFLLVIVAAVIMLPVILGSCGSPLGFGKPIDWEPPVLEMEPIGNPKYVRTGTVLRGLVKDNIGVASVVLLDSKDTTKVLFEAALTPLGSKDSEGRVQYSWELTLDFGDEDNGKKIAAMVVAYDKTGRSGEESMAAVTLVVDTRPPRIEKDWPRIKRTERKEAWLETYFDLKALESVENLELKTHKSANVDRYQNGYFEIKAKLIEDETRIKSVSLNIYDVRWPDIALYSMPAKEGASYFTPSWIVGEHEILSNGYSKLPAEYKETYVGNYRAGERYYYRVAIEAYDLSDNGTGTSITEEAIEDDVGFFCMWERADAPKGVLDPMAVGIPNEKGEISVSRGTPLPVEFFDDDTLEWAYAGLFTEKQWNGESPVSTDGATITGATDSAKLDWLKTRLRSGQEVLNWRYASYGNTSQPIVELLQDTPVTERWEYVQTGNGDTDYGEFMLFSLAGDAKLPPNVAGDFDTLRPRSSSLVWKMSMTDENAPLIVFDTVNTNDSNYSPNDHLGYEDPDDGVLAAATGNSPEENTFPERLAAGSKFEINGYTLREDKGHLNGVIAFRMAWIPYGVPGGPDSLIEKVQDALKDTAYPSVFNGSPELQGVQHWNFIPEIMADGSPGAAPESGETRLIEGSRQFIGEGESGEYRKQVFRKQFDLLGEDDDLKGPGKGNYKNFTYNGSLENETKLFIIYAEDNMGHIVNRQLRLLGKKAPPELHIYDISGLVRNDDMPPGIPNVNNPPYNGKVTTAYDNALKLYNQDDDNVYTALKTGSESVSQLVLDRDYKTFPWQTYPRGTILKYWVKAGGGTGPLKITSISMRDITFSEAGKAVGSEYDPTDGALTFAEYYPDEAQRVFLFEAEDALGNKASIQRTVAITNAAKLESITTTHQDGTYPDGTRIVLRANFSGQISVSPADASKIKLNVRYGENPNYVYRQLDYSAADSTPLSLGFPFTVGLNYGGRLETVYDGFDPSRIGVNARPIILQDDTTKITDVLRESPAFVPGYTSGSATMPNWTAQNTGHLQSEKWIFLDGVHPVITGVSVDGKAVYTPPGGTATNDRYFKSGETISLTLSTGSGKDIRPSTTPPVLRYYIRENPQGNPQGTLQGPYTAFTYQRPGTNTKSLVFELSIPPITTPPTPDTTIAPYNGELVNVSLLNSAGIEDNVGNVVAATNLGNLLNIAGGARIYIKKSIPAAPGSKLTGGGKADQTFTSPEAAQLNYNSQPSLSIDDSTATLGAWEDKKEYSLNGGLAWNTWTAATPIPAGTTPHQLRTRYVDRAGNEGAVASQAVQVNAIFPKLIAVTPLQQNGWVTSGGLDFNLDFAEPVRIAIPTSVSIEIRDRSDPSASPTHTTANYATLTATATTDLVSTIKLTLTSVTANPAKEMRNGLHITSVTFTGLQDRFGNSGGTWNISPGVANIGSKITVDSSDCPNLDGLLKVDAVAPSVTGHNPVNSTGVAPEVSSADHRNVITLTFREPVLRGSGTITIQPKADFLIPPVFEDSGYYLDQFAVGGETKSATSVQGRTTWVAGFYDIYNNNLPLTTAGNAAHRNNLTQSTTAASQALDPSVVGNVPSNALDSTTPSMTRLRLDERTGQPVGPYVKTTHGLIQGNGYSGNYSGNHGTNEINGPHTVAGYTSNVGGAATFTRMVPDTSTKWVLAYQYNIHDATANGAVSNIRAALRAAKFRQQEIDVAFENVAINGATVSITLSEPLLQGLQWTLSYTAGAFTDTAGNNATALAAESYTFWSPGVQKPVIRVDRKSYDARTGNWKQPRSNAAGQNDSRNFTYAEPTGEWGIDAFNTVNYRIESETRGATISFGVSSSNNSTTGSGAAPFNAVTVNAGTTTVTASNDNGIAGTIWSGAVANATTATNWETVGTTRNSFWVRPNLLRKFGISGQFDPRSVQNVNGEQRRSSGHLEVLHSYNADVELGAQTNPAAGTLNAVVLAAGVNERGWETSSVSFGALEAGKRYVVATAARTGQTASARGYEGIFRTLVVLNGQRGNRAYNGNAQDNAAGINKILVGGSNIKAGTPSIPGFPLLDGAHNGDARFVKMMYNFDNHANGTNTGKRFYWVSTEIVCEFYFVYFGNGGALQRTGDVNNYMMVRYGDLSYAFRLDRFPDEVVN